MTIGNKIAYHRKKMNITQDALAQKLGVTNQAVSKWESDQSCPDILLLPKIADIFGVSIDELFDRDTQPKQAAPEEPESRKKQRMGILPWENDDALHVVLFQGHTLLHNAPAAKEITFVYEGSAMDIDSAFAVHCGDVEGDVNAGTDVSCGDVSGDVDAGGSVNCHDVDRDVNAGSNVSCGNVSGCVNAGSSVSCGDVDGDVDAGTDVSCGNVGGDVDAGKDVTCGNVDGDVDAGLNVSCGDVGGDVDAGCTVECGNVEGDIDACGPVTIRK